MKAGFKKRTLILDTDKLNKAMMISMNKGDKPISNMTEVVNEALEFYIKNK